MAEKFNIRIYGILKHSNGSYLLTNECRNGVEMTKFVGGGLEFNEGLKEALIREFKEEMNLDISVNDLFYINDFLQISAFNPNDQLVSIYYTVTTKDWDKIEDCILNPTKEQSFFWEYLDNIKRDSMTFPIDRVVIEQLKRIN